MWLVVRSLKLCGFTHLVRHVFAWWTYCCDFWRCMSSSDVLTLFYWHYSYAGHLAEFSLNIQDSSEGNLITFSCIYCTLDSVTVYVLCVDVTLSQGHNPLDLFFIAVHTTYLHLKVTSVIWSAFPLAGSWTCVFLRGSVIWHQHK